MYTNIRPRFTKKKQNKKSKIKNRNKTFKRTKISAHNLYDNVKSFTTKYTIPLSSLQQGGNKKDINNIYTCNTKFIEENTKNSQLYTLLEQDPELKQIIYHTEMTKISDRTYGHPELFQYNTYTKKNIEDEEELISFEIHYHWNTYLSSITNNMNVKLFSMEEYVPKMEKIVVDKTMVLGDFLTKLYFSMRYTPFYIQLNNLHVTSFAIDELNKKEISCDMTMEELQNNGIQKMNIDIDMTRYKL